MEAGKFKIADDTARSASSGKVRDFVKEACDLKDAVAE
jgi:hypothetical protein